MFNTHKWKQYSLKHKTKRCAVICALLFGIFTMSASTSLHLQAEELTNDSIKEKEASIQSSKAERDQIKSSLSDVKKIKEELEASKQDLTQYVTELDSETTKMQNNIDSLTQKIAEKEAEIEQTEAELEEAQQVQDTQYETMKRRIKFIYEKGDTYYLEILTKAGSFGDMLNKATYVTELSDYDSKQLKKFKEATILVQKTKEALDEQKATLDEEKAGVEQEKANMEALISEKQNQIYGLNGDIQDKEAAIAEYDRQLKEEEAAIAALEKMVAAEKAALAAQNQRHYSGGMFTWPAPSYQYISSEFGYRVHPIFGTTKFHSGLDIAAQSGAPILAAYEGTVVAAAYESSMGNYIMIDHGDGLYTIYMHCSALYVSKGQDVSAGDSIGAVGSTGNSTGPHLHFSVRLNGSYVDPNPYLGR